MADGKMRKEGQAGEGFGFLSFAGDPTSPKYQAEVQEFDRAIGSDEARRWLDQMESNGAGSAAFLAGALGVLWARFVATTSDEADEMFLAMVSEATAEETSG